MKRPNPTIDGGVKDQEQETATKRRTIISDEEIQITTTQRREKALKRPINADPDPESDSNSDTYRELITEEFNEKLASQIPDVFKSVMNFMGASPSNPNLRLVAEKLLTKGDVDERRNRLLIPARKIRSRFHDAEEEEFLNRKKWRPVEIIEPDCTVSSVTLSKRKTKKGPAYALVTEWIGLVERNELEEGQLVHLWSFRCGGKYGRRLCFLLLPMEVPSPSPSPSTESPYATGDDDSDDNNNNNDVVTMNRSKRIQINTRRSIEMALKRPMLSESESESESDSKEEEGIYERKRHEDLAEAIPEQFFRVMSFMGATVGDMRRLRFVTERRLVKCDVDGRRDLFVFPAREVRWRFLSVVEEEVSRREKRLMVEMIDMLNTVRLVTLRKSVVAEAAAEAAAFEIVEWMELVERNDIIVGDMVELWSFRVAGGKCGRLCLMLLKLFD